MLSRFIKPKWKHKDPRVRQAAVRDITDDRILIELANTDPDFDVRRAALRCIEHIDSLLQVEVPQALERACAARYAELTLKNLARPFYTDAQQKFFALIDDASYFKTVAEQAADPGLRLEALQYISDQTVLQARLSIDTNIQIRSYCAAQLQDEQAIRAALQQLGRKDKRITKQLRQKLNAIEATRKLELERERLLSRLDTLGREAHWQRDQTTLLSLKNSWSQLAPPPETQITATFEQTCEAAEKRIAELRAQETARKPLRQEKEQQCEWLERYLEQLNGQQRLAASEARDIQATLDLFVQEWNDLPTLPEHEEAQLANRFHAAVSTCRQRIDELLETSRKTAHLEKILQQAAALLQRKAPSLQQLDRLVTAWQRETMPEDSVLADAYRQQFDQLQQRIRARIDKQARETADGLRLINAWLDEIDTNLSNERLENSAKREHQILELLNALPAIADSQRHQIEARLKNISPQIKNLQGWRHWGTDRAREQLIAEAQALQEKTLSIPERAAAVKDLRQRWKQLGKLDPSTQRKLWQHFDKACTAAYQPCKEHFAQAAQQRNQNLGKRQEVCAALEALLNDTDWSQPDWREADRNYHRLQNRWRSLGPVNRQDWQVILKRYQAAVTALESALEPERERNLQARVSLIDAIEALTEQTDSREALKALKPLQNRWQITVTSKRATEQRLWKQFKAAGDRIYQREQDRRALKSAELNQTMQRKEALLESAEQLVHASKEEIVSGMAMLKQQWAAEPLPNHRSAKSLEVRFNTALRKATDQIEIETLEAQREKLRHALQTLPSTDEHPPVPDDTVTERLLELEIVLGIDSPAAFTKRRMQKQVERLNARLADKQTQNTLETISEQFLQLTQSNNTLDKTSQGRLQNIFEALDAQLITRIQEIKQGD